MDVSNAGERSFFVAILAFIVGSAGMATSLLSVWYNALFPPLPHKPLTIDDLRLLREHHGSATPTPAVSAKSTSASSGSGSSANPDGDVDTPLPEPFQKPGFAKTKLRPMLTNAARRVSFTEPPSPTIMANALADRLRAVKPRHRSPSPPKPTPDDASPSPGPSYKDSSATPSPPARCPSILRMTRVWSSGHAKRASLGSIDAPVSEFGERKPPLARARTSCGMKEPALAAETVTEDVAAEEAAEHPPASTQTQPERGRFGWRLRRSKTGDALARPRLQRKSTSPAAGPPQFLPPTPNISPLALPVSISPTSSAPGAQGPSTSAPAPAPPRRVSAIQLPPADQDPPARRASAPTRRLSALIAPATRAAGLRSPSLPTPPRRLSSILCHPSPPPAPAPTSPRTQPYGAPYFTPPPDAGPWAVPAGDKRASLPADLRAR